MDRTETTEQIIYYHHLVTNIWKILLGVESFFILAILPITLASECIEKRDGDVQRLWCPTYSIGI